MAEDGRPARVGSDQGGQHPDGGGLAGAVGTEEGEHLARLDVEGDAVDRPHRAEADLELRAVDRERGPARLPAGAGHLNDQAGPPPRTPPSAGDPGRLGDATAARPGSGDRPSSSQAATRSSTGTARSTTNRSALSRSASRAARISWRRSRQRRSRCSAAALSRRWATRPSAGSATRRTSPASTSRCTRVLTVLGASRSSAAASWTRSPGRRSTRRRISSWASGRGGSVRPGADLAVERAAEPADRPGQVRGQGVGVRSEVRARKQCINSVSDRYDCRWPERLARRRRRVQGASTRSLSPWPRGVATVTRL